MAVNPRELESNRLNNPRANVWALVQLGVGGGLIGTIVIWDLAILSTNKIFGIEYDKGLDLFGPIITCFQDRGFIWTDFVFMVIGAALIIGTIYLLVPKNPHKKAKTRVDVYAAALGHGDAVKGLLEPAAKTKAQRLLKLNPGETAPPGLPLGKLVYDGQKVYSDWEAEMLVVAGPRTGKSVSFVIPHIVIAPGPCIATSNKRDIVDGTRALRETNGRKVWLFDPEGIASGKADWYWNPLNFIRDIKDAFDIAACWRAAAGLGSSGQGGGNDEFFNGSAEQQLANFLFAAAIEGLTMREVFKWCQDENNSIAGQILQRHNYSEPAEQVFGIIGITPETKSGIYAGLKKMVSFMVDEKILPWIQKMDENDDRPEYNPFEFALSRDTLYLLSQKGANSTPITAALTAVTAKSGYDLSQNMGGRLPVPLVAVLDECANICPWPELPEVYSYYGSCGIIINALFQNVSQGELAFGKAGFKSLFDNANTKVYIGGNADSEFLQQLSSLIGQRDVMRYNVNNNSGWTDSESQSIQQEQTLSVQQLAELPQWRGVVLSSQNRAALIALTPWFEDPQIKDKIEYALKESKKLIADTFSKEEIMMNAAQRAKSRNANKSTNPARPAKQARPATPRIVEKAHADVAEVSTPSEASDKPSLADFVKKMQQQKEGEVDGK
jgi:type IV secretory pathway TraG/TraD family ATPase VirD4